jgi:Zn-dependent peptidase ImmA (M78 family)/transcriptional regulator with XRE-family HTH domain
MEAFVKPELLIWAREAVGFSIEEAAKRASVALSTLQKAEAGQGRVSMTQLNSLADAYKRPIAAFYLPSPPPKPTVVPDFRRLPGGLQKQRSVALNVEIRRARQRREDTIRLATELESSLPTFSLSFSLSTPVETAARTIRDYLALSVDEQLTWRKSDVALKKWKQVLEAKGVLVFEVSRIPVSEMRGVALSFDALPIILLNGADEHNARVFSLFHELVHLSLGVSAIDDAQTDENWLSPEEKKVEQYCNAVAAEFLTPKDAFLHKLGQQNQADGLPQRIAELAKTFSVSREVIARRLLSSKKITENLYIELRAVFKAEYDAYMKSKKDEQRSKGTPIRPEVMQARNLSATFVKIALDAYSQDSLSLNSASDILGVKARGVAKLRDYLRSSAPV